MTAVAIVVAVVLAAPLCLVAVDNRRHLEPSHPGIEGPPGHSGATNGGGDENGVAGNAGPPDGAPPPLFQDGEDGVDGNGGAVPGLVPLMVESSTFVDAFERVAIPDGEEERRLAAAECAAAESRKKKAAQRGTCRPAETPDALNFRWLSRRRSSYSKAVYKVRVICISIRSRFHPVRKEHCPKRASEMKSLPYFPSTRAKR